MVLSASKARFCELPGFTTLEVILPTLSPQTSRWKSSTWEGDRVGFFAIHAFDSCQMAHVQAVLEV